MWTGAQPPIVENDYVLEGEVRGLSTARVQVLAAKRTDQGWQVRAQLCDDPVRLLAKSNGYTNSAARALRDGGDCEPEAVSAEDQERMSAAAREAARDAADPLLTLLEQADALLCKAANHPDAKTCSRELWQARGRLGAARSKLGARLAAA